MHNGFDVSKVILMLQIRKTENRQKNEDVELDEDHSQPQKQLTQQQGVTQQAVSNHLQEMEKLHKIGRWGPHKLNDKWKSVKTHVKFCSFSAKGSLFALHSNR